MGGTKKIKSFSDLEGIWKGKSHFSFVAIELAEIGVKEDFLLPRPMPEAKEERVTKKKGAALAKAARKA